MLKIVHGFWKQKFGEDGHQLRTMMHLMYNVLKDSGELDKSIIHL